MDRCDRNWIPVWFATWFGEVLENVARRHLNGRVPLDVDVMSKKISDVLLGGIKNGESASPRTETGKNNSRRSGGRSKA